MGMVNKDQQRYRVQAAEWIVAQVVAVGLLLFTDWLSYHPVRSKLVLALVLASVVPSLVYLSTYLAPLSRYREGTLRLVRLLILVTSLGFAHFMLIAGELRSWAIFAGALLVLLIVAGYLNS